MKRFATLAAMAAALLAGCSDTGGGGRPTPERPSLEGSYVGQRASMECYTFHADGTVELRYSGASAATYVGTYARDTGSLVWNSGKTPTVAAGSDGVVVDGLRLAPIATCG